MKRILTILLPLLCAASFGAMAQEIVSAEVSKDTILIGDQVEWTSSIRVPRGMRASIDSMAGYVVPGVELLGAFTVDTVERGRDFSMVRTRALVTSFDSGSYVLPPLVVYFDREDGTPVDTLRLPGVPLEVTTVPVDTATYQMYDIRPQFRYPLTFREVLPWGLAAAAAAAVIFLAVKAVLRHRRKSPVLPGRPVPEEPPHVTALRELDRIRNEKLWQSGKQKQYYTEITDALRLYIERRFGIKTIERTSNEILTDLSVKELRPEDFGQLKELFSMADLVKFAKYTASESENENAVPAAVRFVNGTCADMEEKKDE